MSLLICGLVLEGTPVLESLAVLKVLVVLGVLDMLKELVVVEVPVVPAVLPTQVGNQVVEKQMERPELLAW